MITFGLRIRPVLAGIVLLTSIFILTGLILRFATPALSLQHVLWQARYALLAWRLCLYVSCAALFFSLYRRLPPRGRQKLKHIACWSLVLFFVGEISNALQWGDGA
ncbi:hypothetical protein EHW66_20440 [Erwinia psidii]|uniref:hypothetical protein n=1 Tax=Erwinia psidii TaxID=69224 RepID=UPI00226B343D|nr:hypothetical protein [Erwinia psidii]MCX8967251.1 hypothetical protein [Erwinia psidii]